MYRRFFKQVFDFSISLSGLVILAPLIGLLTILLFFSNKGNPFFTQLRPGKGERVFRLIKFKTMNSCTDESGKLLPDVERLTSVGKFVRSISLDEIPQLLNVLMGQMSLVGPRPLLVKYLDRYTREQNRRHEVKPGITGWAQINGRNAISWDKKFVLDVFYVDNLSLSLDVKILFETIKKVVTRHGVTGVGQATVGEFKGDYLKVD